MESTKKKGNSQLHEGSMPADHSATEQMIGKTFAILSLPPSRLCCVCDRQVCSSPLLYLDRRAVRRAVRFINTVVALLRAQPGQADRAVINEFKGFADHIFLNLSFAHGTGHHAGANDAVPAYLLSFFVLNGKRSRNKACAKRQAAQYEKVTTISIHVDAPSDYT
jgi:hypothetical protein